MKVTGTRTLRTTHATHQCLRTSGLQSAKVRKTTVSKHTTIDFFTFYYIASFVLNYESFPLVLSFYGILVVILQLSPSDHNSNLILYLCLGVGGFFLIIIIIILIIFCCCGLKGKKKDKKEEPDYILENK